MSTAKPVTKKSAAKPVTTKSVAKKPLDKKTAEIKEILTAAKVVEEAPKSSDTAQVSVATEGTETPEVLQQVSPSVPAGTTTTNADASNLEEDEDEVEVPEPVKDVFLISKALCMKCVHLCPETGTDAPTNCHYDNGNEDCPARVTMIQLGMSRKEIDKAATAIVEATANGDFERLNTAAQRLARKSEAVRAAVSARVLELQSQKAQVA